VSPGPRRRRAAALAAVLALHGALVLALGLGLVATAPRPMALQAGGEPAVLQVRTLAPEARPAGEASSAPDALPQPAAPAFGPLPAPALALAGELMRHGSRLQLAFPDAELPAPLVTVTLALRLDRAGHLISAQPLPGQQAPAALVQHVQEALQGARLLGSATAPARLCLHVRFDAVETAVAWWFEASDPQGLCGGPGPGAWLTQSASAR
jgi:hypothetical protein